MFAWLRRAIATPALATSAGRATAGGALELPRKPRAATPRATRVNTEPPGAGAYLTALGLDPLLAVRGSLRVTPENEQEEELVVAVLAHGEAHRPSPASAPRQALAVLNMVAQSSTRLDDLCRVITADAALTAAVLRVANSPALRGHDEVDNVRDAVTRVGLEEVGRVAASIGARSLFSPRARAEMELFAPIWRALFPGAAAQGMAAADLAMRTPHTRSDHLFLGGLVHDIGKALALQSLGTLVLDGAVPRGIPVESVLRVVDLCSAQLGEAAHTAWELPGFLHVMCARARDPVVPASPESTELHLLRAVHALHDLLEQAPWTGRSAAILEDSAHALGWDTNTARYAWTCLKQAQKTAQQL